jgi:hypothetical protein
MGTLAVYYEHPEWFRPLFTELERRGVPYVKLAAGEHMYDLNERAFPYDLVFNRASPSAYLRGHTGTIFSTSSWLSHLERLGVPVVNGSRIFAHEISKARQLTALEELNIDYPRARLVNHPRGGCGIPRASVSYRRQSECRWQWSGYNAVRHRSGTGPRGE